MVSPQQWSAPPNNGQPRSNGQPYAHARVLKVQSSYSRRALRLKGSVSRSAHNVVPTDLYAAGKAVEPDRTLLVKGWLREKRYKCFFNNNTNTLLVITLRTLTLLYRLGGNLAIGTY